ncbi:chemotaxis protein CheA [Bdellovibrio sp. KM01]|uniref:chemotaxis protein CheA n=1 Tax=Bdellovibrio sp. KM01 TaxID=2748865 RepID=UPI0015E9FA09|nr:ATP-binding protein [Bdellovibrio sp. KM01]QLY25954.1 chemotaxis protein CheW [Bdellovibrio sp. KM01]
MSDDQNGVNDIPDFSGLIDFEQIEEVARVFFEESKEILDGLDSLIMRLEESPNDVEHINVLFRKVHTIKGSVGSVPGGQLLASLSHEFEALLNRIKRESQTVTKECIDLFLLSSRLMKQLAEALREKRDMYPEELSEVIETITRYNGFEFSGVAPRKTKRAAVKPNIASGDEDGVWMSSKQLNEMLRLSGELLVLKNFFSMMNQTVNFRSQPELFERRQSDFSQNLTKITDQFQSHLQVIRKEKAEDSFQSIPVLVRQTATELNKTVQLQMVGLDFLIDKSLAKDISESLVHLVRNSIDHGIEDQFERAVAGKDSIGQLTIEMSEKNGAVYVVMKDDGKGLDRERILQRAITNELVKPEDVATISDEEIYKCIFEPGFSTKEKITTVSGRGVGMDVVSTLVEKYGGHISISTQMGAGTTFTLVYPAISHILVETAMVASWNNFQVAVPLTSVAHITSCSSLQLNYVEHFRYCQFHNQTVPLMTYQEIRQGRMLLPESDFVNHTAIFIRIKDSIIALLVDRVEAQTDLVVKGFGAIIKAQKGFKGFSILADEKITYIVDPEQILAMLSQSVTLEAAA